MVITFCGHSQLLFSDEKRKILYNLLEEEIIKNPDCIFYLGAYGDFDRICHEIINELKKKYAKITTVFVTPYLHEKYGKLQFVKCFYDEVIYPPLEKIPKRLAIIKRNEWMVENADLIIAYVNCSFGGAARALEYAKKIKKSFINLAT